MNTTKTNSKLSLCQALWLLEKVKVSQWTIVFGDSMCHSEQVLRLVKAGLIHFYQHFVSRCLFWDFVTSAFLTFITCERHVLWTLTELILKLVQPSTNEPLLPTSLLSLTICICLPRTPEIVSEVHLFHTSCAVLPLIHHFSSGWSQ